ncbi:olfactory receptor 4E1-like [Polymixia lowei]
MVMAAFLPVNEFDKQPAECSPRSLSAGLSHTSLHGVKRKEGLNYTVEHRLTLFSLTLLWYLLILLVNVALIVTIIQDKNLHEPMYILLCNLCINALYGTAGFYPKFLLDLLSPHVISYAACLLQAFVMYSFACGDLSLLSVMAYDRYVAICRPLEYHSVMTRQRLFQTCANSVENRRKFMETCVPHLISLVTFLVTIVFDVMYMRFGSKDVHQMLQNFIAIEFLIIPPVMNPLIYGFKLTKIRKRFLDFITVNRK